MMAKGRERLLAELRRRGARGGIIGPHRALVKGRLTPWRLTSMVLIPVLLASGTGLLLAPLSDWWTWVLTLLQRPLGLPGTVARDAVTIAGRFSLAVPYFTTDAPLPGPSHYWLVGGICAVALGASFILSRRFTPLIYFLRFAVLIQLTAVLNFVLRGGSFPYDLPRYLVSLFHIGAAVLILMPLVLGFTYFPFNIATWRKVLVTALCVGHIAVLLPLQVTVHAYLIHHLSLLVMPTLFFLWGILLHLFVFVALYAWAMSWPDVTPRVSARGMATSTGRV